MWFGVNPLRWNKPTAVSPRDRRSLKRSLPAPKPTTAATTNAKEDDVSLPTSTNQAPASVPTSVPPSMLPPLLPPKAPGPTSAHVLFGHTAGVCALLAADDRYIVSASMDATLRVWSRGSFHCYHVLRGHRDVVCSAAINQTFLLSASHDSTVGVWLCLDDFKLKRRLVGHSGHVTHVVFVHAALALSAAEDKTLRLWQCEVGLCLAVLLGHDGYVSSLLLLSFSSSVVWSGAADGSVCVWRVAPPSTAPLACFRAHRRTVQSLVALDQDRFVASASNDGRLQLYDATSMTLLRQLTPGPPLYTLHALSPTTLVVATGDGHLLRIDTATGRTTGDLHLHSTWISHAQLQGRVAACAANGGLFLVDVDAWRVIGETDSALILSLAWLNDSTVLTAGSDGLIHCTSFHVPSGNRGKLIGRGRFGKVYCGLLLSSATMVAVKQVRIKDCGFDEIEGTFVPVEEVSIEHIEQEVRIGLSLYHPHVVEYFGAEQDGNIYNLFMEYLPLGSVSGLLKSFGPLDESIVCAYTAQLLHGLRYLRARGIAHRDLKCANLLLCDSGCIKIADFGTAKLTSDASLAPFDATHLTSSAQDGVGSSFWMSPEIIRADAYGSDGWTKSDIWSVGCCVIEMATGKPPWSNFSNPLTAMFHIASDTTIPDLPPHLSPAAQDFLRLCFVKDPQERPTAEWLLSHPFFHQLPTLQSQYGWHKATTKPLDGGRWWFDDESSEWIYWVPAQGGYWFASAENPTHWLWHADMALSAIAIARFWLHMVRHRQDDDRASAHEMPTEQTPTNVEEEMHVRVVAEYSAADDSELSVATNDILVVETMDENGWWMGYNVACRDKRGWFPCNYVEWLQDAPREYFVGVVRAVSDYNPPTVDAYLALVDQELVAVIETPDDGWWRGRKLTREAASEGWFPSTFVEWLATTHTTEAYRSDDGTLDVAVGASVAVLQQQDGWIDLIVLETGARGWLPASALKDDGMTSVMEPTTMSDTSDDDDDDDDDEVVIIDTEHPEQLL
ncbi:Aste57867_17121 [Aphanomyces stellatus]|uniref:Aste57867_17121 protein n=1 Tax=Aphanomyces stellatus TaxID=120398 RepID=A0A485L7C9_9STRA|nr:hypothetical protein As57867_017062 [Aphanomyces stellatus]VFT93879.1 Aste57867_17121 [Aphanomyces stellatus]